MSLKINLDDELKKLPNIMRKLTTKIIVKSARQGINKTVDSTTTESSKKIRELRKIKKSDLKRFIKKTRAKGSTLAQLEGDIKFSGRAVGMINFIVGNRTPPRPDPKLKVKQRKPISKQVRPGKKVKMRHAFIAKGRGGKAQVFQRMTKNRFPIARQAVPGIARLVERSRLKAQLQDFSSKRLSLEFGRAMKVNLEKERLK